jgi:hypothetical protein
MNEESNGIQVDGASVILTIAYLALVVVVYGLFFLASLVWWGPLALFGVPGVIIVLLLGYGRWEEYRYWHRLRNRFRN